MHLKRDAILQGPDKVIERSPPWERSQQALDSYRHDPFRSMCLLVPERDRLAEMMASNEPLSKAATWKAIQEIHYLCMQSSTVLYLPGHTYHLFRHV